MLYRNPIHQQASRRTTENREAVRAILFQMHEVASANKIRRRFLNLTTLAWVGLYERHEEVRSGHGFGGGNTRSFTEFVETGLAIDRKRVIYCRHRGKWQVATDGLFTWYCTPTAVMQLHQSVVSWAERHMLDRPSGPP